MPLKTALLISSLAMLNTLGQPDLSLQATTPGNYDLNWTTSGGWQYWLEESLDLSDWLTVDGFPKVGSGVGQNRAITFQPQAQFFRVATDPNRLLYLELPEDGTRYDTYEEFDGPRWPDTYGEGHVTLWHQGKLAAYSITIDDNNSPDFPFWLDVSETYGWRLTWFVIVYPYVWDIYNDLPGNNTSYFGTLAEWKTLVDLGQDIQLHGACNSMNDQTAEEYEDQIIRSIDVMEEVTGTQILTFAYPCGKLTDPSGEHDYLEIIRRYTISARGGTGGGTTPVHLLDYHTTKSLGVNALVNGEPSSLFSRYDDKRSFLYSQYRGWCVTLYHGISEGGEPGIIETLDWVKAHEDEFWVGAYTDVAKYAQERESATLNITSATADRIELNVTDQMEDAIFDHPLTVKIRVDENWNNVSATQNGTPITAYMVQNEGENYVYAEPIPDRGDVVLNRL